MGHTKSCGRLLKEHIIKVGKNNKTHGESKEKFYHIWSGMKSRCDNQNSIDYKNYGGRGITYNPKWKIYKGFKEDMWFKWIYAKKKFGKKIKLSLERINVNGNYCFENCIFIPMSEQYKNKQKDQLILYLFQTILILLNKKGV